MNFKSWIGIDLDGTLAYYDGWKSIDHVGEPIPLMQSRVLRWIAQGKDVRIFTARIWPLRDVNPEDDLSQFIDAEHTLDQSFKAAHAIQLWCEQHLGRRLPITCAKNMAMESLWDDRAIQVVPNTGQRVDGCVD